MRLYGQEQSMKNYSQDYQYHLPTENVSVLKTETAYENRNLRSLLKYHKKSSSVSIPPQNLKEKKLVNNATMIKWIQTRNLQAKNQYRLNKMQMVQDREIENVFNKFDADQSGTIEMEELYQMFTNYGVDITRNDIKRLFNVVDQDGSGALSLEEFKEFSSNPHANKVFRKIITKARQSQEKLYGSATSTSYLPFNLQRVLDYLSHMAKRESLLKSIEDKKYDYDNATDNIKNFIKLFLIDGAAQECLLKERTNVSIENKLQINKNDENSDQPFIRENSILKQVTGISKMDDDELDELSESVMLYQPAFQRENLQINGRNTPLEQIFEKDSFKTDEDSDLDLYMNEEQNQVKIDRIVNLAKKRGRSSAQQEIIRFRKDYQSIMQPKRPNYNAVNNLEQNKQYKIRQNFRTARQDQELIEPKKSKFILQNKYLQQNQKQTMTKQHSPVVLTSVKHKKEDLYEFDENRTSIQRAQNVQYKIKLYPGGLYQPQKFSSIDQVNVKPLNKSAFADQLNKDQGKLPGILKSKQVRYDSLIDKTTMMKQLIDNARQQTLI
ncbi:ef hand family protein [Stylonychia lemnae]|uniref:Ef hand family protein n=1 Tax=Stylonychia lemnae TaxID=5949 RepID=A0A078B1H7_STYLE|nr:ef hand family protein [Stylonychia lemnae]|eukprot:CDW88415.1 ef hand family protein [Stylonychia lemnae]